MKNEEKIIIDALVPLPLDERDFQHSAVFGATLATPPGDFDVLNGSKVKNQFNLDFCAGFSVAEINEDMQGATFCPLYQFAKIKQIQGNYTSWGADLRSACQSATKFGSLPIEKSPFIYDPSSEKTRTRDFLANWSNWSQSSDILAGEFKNGSYFAVDGPGDYFDNIRNTLWQNREEHRGVIIGVMWRGEWTYAPGGVVPEANYVTPSGSGHAIKVCGQKTINGKVYLRIQNSWGEEYGDKGYYYFPRSVINLEVKQFGAFVMKDMDPELVKQYISLNLVTRDDVIGSLVKLVLQIAVFFKSLLS